MKKRNSTNSEVLKIETLIRDYLNNKDNSITKIELSDMNIGGNDLVNALDNINLEIGLKTYKKLKEDYEDLKANYEGVHKYYEQQNEDQKNLIGTIELLLKDPFVQFINKVNDLTKVLKEVR